MLGDLGKQVIQRVEPLVDDAGLLLVAVLGRAADELVVKVVRRRGSGAQHDVGVGIGREDHVEELREVLVIGLVVVGLEDVEQATGLKTLAELLDGLGTDTVDVKQVVLGLADKVAHRLDAHLAELVGPALRHAKVVEQVELCVLTRQRAAVLGVHAGVAEVVAHPVELLRKLLLDLLELIGRPLGELLGHRARGPIDLLAMVRELHVVVGGKAGAGRDLLAHDDVGLEVHEVVHFAGDGGLGEDASGADERRARQPRVDGARDLERTEDGGLGLGRGAAGEVDVVHRAGELVAVDVLAHEVLGVAGVGDLDAAQHLARDDLDVLVVELDALGGVDVLHALDERVHRGLDVREAAQVAEVHEALRDLVAGSDLAAILDTRHEAGTGGDALLVEHTGRVVGVEDADEVLGLLGRDGETTGERGQVGLATENLLVHVAHDVEHAADGRQALRDVVGAGDAAGVNRAHRELRARLADGLRGDDAHRGAHVDRTTGREVPAVALLAHAVL